MKGRRTVGDREEEGEGHQYDLGEVTDEREDGECEQESAIRR